MDLCMLDELLLVYQLVELSLGDKVVVFPLLLALKKEMVRLGEREGEAVNGSRYMSTQGGTHDEFTCLTARVV